jgi:menaquinone-dependent protoporphyrinogen oxidase
VLIVYGSTHGQTARIAERVRDQLARSGCLVVLARGDSLAREPRLGEYDGVIVGASVIGGKYQDYIARFVGENRDALNHLPSAFFGVSGSAASPYAENRAAAATGMELFLAEAGWRPRLTASMAGAMRYSSYNPFLRFVMRRVARKNGEVDTRHDREYTDWVQVRRFAEGFHALLPQPAARGIGDLVEA